MIYLDHIAILVASIDDYLPLANPHGWPTGPIESFPSEGTREVYLGPEGSSRILILEPIEDGPYLHAYIERGEGLHHIAFNTPDVEAFLKTLAGTGWYLHPASIATFRQCKTVWLTAKGQPFLVELHQSDLAPTPWATVEAPGDPERNQCFSLQTADPLRVTADGSVLALPKE